jgi:hypothetical protein
VPIPARFIVAAGDVVYLGELHLVEGESHLGNLGERHGVLCSMDAQFSVKDILDRERDSINRIVQSRYPGAKERLKTSLIKIYSGTLSMRPGYSCQP